MTTSEQGEGGLPAFIVRRVPLAQLYRERVVLGLTCSRCGQAFAVDYPAGGFAGNRGPCPACGVEQELRPRDIRLSLERSFRRAVRRIEARDVMVWKDILTFTIANSATLLRPLLMVMVVHFHHHRFGHYVVNTANLLRYLRRGGHGDALLFAITPNPATESNRHLREKWGERFIITKSAIQALHLLEDKPAQVPVWSIPAGKESLDRDYARGIMFLSRRMSPVLPPRTAELKQENYRWQVDVEKIPADSAPLFAFGEDEENRAAETLAKAGIDVERGFVLFLGRDSAYTKKRGFCAADRDGQDFKNMNADDFLPAMHWVTANGMSAVRLGRHVEKILSPTGNGIIDCSAMPPDDFRDVHLIAKCRFMVSAGAGPAYLALLQGKWVLRCNMPHIYSPLAEFHYPRCCFMFKKYWCHREQRFLSFREIFARRLEDKQSSDAYFDEEVTLVENTREELLTAARETWARAAGAWTTTEEERELRDRYLRLVRKTYAGFEPRFDGILCHSFMKMNPWLLADA
ncbi:MAG: TIGR04372 family glycosyltransferase [Planctomycetota bacterium]|nr:TIGR04372 family glycosyltransferase [Planctomycetota bacterium]